ncbi:MAG: hypothetical protein SFY80_15120 [Verrucomicrobiota bacterium]|nr:hypothetical protein [Verrucomicrobiota bacterium]
MPLNIDHYNHFTELLSELPYEQGPVGDTPARYVAVLNEVRQHQFEWPKNFPLHEKLNRAQVGEICRDPAVHPLIGYAAVMAWGGRGLRYPHYRNSLTGRSGDNLIKILEQLRTSDSDRIHDFNAMQQAAENINGLGIAFYTKLLYFFRPQPNAYILDRHLARSVSLLYDPCLNPGPYPCEILTGQDGSPDPQTNPKNYEGFCRFIEAMGRLLNQDIPAEAFDQALRDGIASARPWTGEAVELALFGSSGGNWREYVENNFDDDGDDDEEQPDQVPLVAPGGPRKPRRPIGGVANANDGNGSEEWRQLAEYIRDTHIAAVKAGRDLPGHIPNIGVRLDCGFDECRHIANNPTCQWVYYLYQSKVKVGVFFNRRRTDELINGLNIPIIQEMVEQDGFIFRQRNALSIVDNVDQGWTANQDNYEGIAVQAVNIMERLRAIL